MKSLVSKLLIGLLLVFGCAVLLIQPPKSSAVSIIRYVSPLGDDSNSCTSTSEPCKTIAAAVLSSRYPDIIYIQAGMYFESVRILDGMTLSGGWNQDFSAQVGFTVIDGSNLQRVLEIDYGIFVALDHLVIQHGNAESGAGLVNHGSLVIQNSEVRLNTGGGISNTGDITISNSSVLSNTLLGGIVSSAGNVIIINCTIGGNSSPAGAGLDNSPYSTTRIYNSTISGNTATVSQLGGIRSFGFLQTRLYNSIVAGNTPGDVYGVGVDRHSVVSQAPLLGPLQGLPAYYPLLVDSPALNKGLATGCLDNLNNLLEYDIRGHPRAGPCDAGSYEGGLQVAKRLTNGLERNKPAHYQVVLTNIQSVELTDVTLTDTIPLELNLVPGTVSANRGVLTRTNDALLWSGSVAYTEPVTITYSALVSESVPLGTVVTNNILATWQGYPFTTSVVAQLRTFTFMPNVAATHCGDFIEDFQNKEGGWPIVDDDYVMMGYSEMYPDVHYVIQPKKHYYLFMARAPTCLRSNYSVEVQADWANGHGSDIGLIFGLEGNFDYFYLFDINTYWKEYQVLRVTPTEVIQWVPPTYSDAIDGNFFARNLLKVIVFHGTLILEINGQRVAAYPGAAVMAAETGSGIFAGDLIYGPLEEADFDNFRVTHLHNDAVVSLSEGTVQDFEPGASLSRVRAPQATGIEPGILELAVSWQTWPGEQPRE